jgi:hypothetical protein
MLAIPISGHAAARIQQRAVQPEIVEYLLDFGRHEYDHLGGVIYYFDKRGRERLLKAIGKRNYLRVEHSLDAYAVFAVDGELVTVGHRYKRITHH